MLKLTGFSFHISLPRRFIEIVVLYVLIAVVIASRGLAAATEGTPITTQWKLLHMQELVAELPRPDAESILIEAVGDDDSQVRYDAMSELSKRGLLSNALVQALTNLAHSDDPETRRLALSTLIGATKDTERLRAIVVRALTDPNPAVRILAIAAAGTFAPAVRCAASDLAGATHDVDERVRIAAVRAMGQLSCEVGANADAFSTLIQTGSPEQRIEVLKALATVRGGADSLLSTLVHIATQEPDIDVRCAAVLALQNVTAGSEILRAFDSIVRDTSPQVRKAAALSVGRLSNNERGATGYLSLLLKDRDASVRASVAEAIRYSPVSEEVLAVAASGLSDTSSSVRHIAATSLDELLRSARVKEANALFDDDLVSTESIDISKSSDWPAALVKATTHELLRSDSDAHMAIIAALGSLRVVNTRIDLALIHCALSDPDPVARIAAINALIRPKLSSIALHGLIQASTDKIASVRSAALSALGRLAEPDVLPAPFIKQSSVLSVQRALARGLADKSTLARISAANAVEILNIKLDGEQFTYSPGLSAALRRMVRDSDPLVKVSAVKALASIAFPTIVDVHAMVDALQDTDIELCVAAVEALTGAPLNVIDVEKALGTRTISLISDSPKAVLLSAKHELRSALISVPLAAALARLVDSTPSTRLRLHAFEALLAQSFALSRVVRAFEEGRPPSDDEFSLLAIRVTDDADPIIASMSSRIVNGLRDPDPKMRSAAAGAIGILSIRDADAERALLGQLHDENPDVRRASADTLPRVIQDDDTPARAAAIDGLVSLSHDSDEKIAETSIESLGVLKATTELRAMIGSADPHIRAIVVQQLATAKPPPQEMRSVLSVAMVDRDYRVRQAALRYVDGLGWGGREFRAPVAALLHDERWDIRESAADALAFYGDDSAFAVESLRLLLDDESEGARESAIRTLGFIGSAAGVVAPRLAQFLNDVFVGKIAEAALKKFGQAAIAAVRDESLHASDPEARIAATTFLHELVSAGSSQLTVMQRGGKPEVVQITDRTVILAVETWCPHSVALRDFLSRKDVVPYFKNLDVIFLFEDETTTVRERLGHATSPERQSIISRKLASVQQTGYFDPSFVIALPYRLVQINSFIPLSVREWPSIFVGTENQGKHVSLEESSWTSVDDWVASDWFRDHVAMPFDLKSEFRSISGRSQL
jgi:HEAT repeat protein